MDSVRREATTDQKVAMVFAAMSAIFGELWVRKYGDDDDALGTWASVLGDLSERQVSGGIEMVRKSWESEYPPTPARFRKWALDSVRPYDIVPEDRRIGVQPAQEHVKQAHLQRLKQEFGLVDGEGGI